MSLIPTATGTGKARHQVWAFNYAASGKPVAKYAYGPFGECVMAVGEAREVCPFRFSTKYFDKATGLHYYGYRYYSASMGRWLNRDPIGEEGGVNVYGFVGNDPVNKWDYLGLKSGVDCFKLAGEIIAQTAKLAAEFAKYDPIADAKGGFPIKGKTRILNGKSYQKYTKPGGHYNEINELKKDLRNRLDRFKLNCWDDDDDCKPAPRIPALAFDLARRPVPPPIYQLSPIQRWIVSVPDESIPTPAEAFLYGAGIGLVGVGASIPATFTGLGLFLSPASQ